MKNTAKQQVARQRVGRQVGLSYGRQNGIKNQSCHLTKTLSKQTIWLYKDKENLTEIKVLVQPQLSFANLVNILQSKTPNPNINIKINISPFYKVIHGERRKEQMYGWRLWFVIL